MSELDTNWEKLTIEERIKELKGGRVSPQDILSGYRYSEARRFHFLKDMARDIDAMRKLGVSDAKIRKELSKRRGLGKDIIRDLIFGDNFCKQVFGVLPFDGSAHGIGTDGFFHDKYGIL